MVFGQAVGDMPKDVEEDLRTIVDDPDDPRNTLYYEQIPSAQKTFYQTGKEPAGNIFGDGLPFERQISGPCNLGQ